MATSSEIVVRELGEITKVLQYEMHNEMSEHPNARLVCEVSQAFLLRELAECDKQIHIERTDTGETIFTGYVDDAALEERQSGYFILDLSLIGGSILLDQKKKYRSYQDVTLKHKDIIEEVMKDAPEVTLKCELTDDKEIGKPLIQYGETDWEFIKRVASRVNEPTFVDETTLLPYLHAGRKSGCATGRNVVARCVSEGMDARFYRLGELAKENGRAAYYFYKLTGKDNYYIGEQVAYNGSEFYICEKEARLEQEELCYTYTLAKDTYMKIPPLYNPRLTGASVLGTIKNVSGETMELALNLKDEVDSSVRYAYDWRPEVGNLMYCMPKVETVVSLYFPSDDEQDAYAVNCVRKIQEEKESLFDETTKTFLTEDGKLMAMASSALHLCAVNPESENGNDYAQLSMVDTMTVEGEAANGETTEVVTEGEVTVEDILEKMGIMLAGSHDVQMVGASIRLESAYVDLFAGGKISIMTGALEEGSKANASVELSAAYFSITADGEVVFALEGRVGENTFCVIWDEPKKVANKEALFWNAVIGVAIVAAVAAACVFALPLAMGGLVAAGTITAATASSIAMGAAIGATATGVFAVVEQYKEDEERGEASTILQTVVNISFKSVAGAAEGALMAYFGGTNLVAEGAKFLSKQTFKNIGKRFLLNQGGSFLVQTGEVAAGLLVDALGGKEYTGEDILTDYLTGIVTGTFTTGLDVIKEIPFVKKASDGVTNWVKDKLKNTKLGKFVQEFGDAKKYGKEEVKQDTIVDQGKAAVKNAQTKLDGMEEAATQKVDGLKEKIEATVQRISTTPLGKQGYLKSQKEHFERQLKEALEELAKIDVRKLQQQRKIDFLKENVTNEFFEGLALKWNTWSVCSAIKLLTDIGDNTTKKALGEEIAEKAIKENVKEWLTSEEETE